MVVSRTTISWAVRITNRNTDGCRKRSRSVPAGPAKVVRAESGRDSAKGVTKALTATFPLVISQAEASSG